MKAQFNNKNCKCQGCELEFFTINIISKASEPGKIFNKNLKPVFCPGCNSENITRVEIENNGFPMVGAHSTKNEYNKQRGNY